MAVWVNEVRSAGIFTQKMHCALPTFGFGICPARCSTEMSHGDGWEPVNWGWGQQAARFFQNSGLTDFRL